MAEPTLKDVLNALAELRKGQSEIRSAMTTKAEMNQRFAEMNQRFDKVDEAIAELDADVERHMKVHKEIDKRLDALKPRPRKVTARMPRRR